MSRTDKFYSRQVQSLLLKSTSSLRSFSTSMRFDSETDYYKKLGVKNTATQTEIKRKFYELAKKHHPDAA